MIQLQQVYRKIQIQSFQMQEEVSEKNCTKHNKQIQYICLDEQCAEAFLLCEICKSGNLHKHSKTTIEDIQEIKKRLIQKWDHETSSTKCRAYLKKVRQFYDKMRKDVLQLISQDQRLVQSLIQKISYHHLPVEANSLTYSEFKKQQYERLDKASLLKLIQESESGQMNKNLEQQKQITNLLDVELTKAHQKLMTLKYVLLSKKIQAQLLTPKIQQNSKICHLDEFSKIYGLFNSKNLVIRSAKLIYRGSDSGFSDKKYYNACNNQLNTLTLIKLANGRKAGGFSTVPLVYHDEQNQIKGEEIKYAVDRSRRNFVFNLTHLASYDVKNTFKSIGYKKNSIGPIFGEDLNISSIEAQSNLGNSYQCPDGISVDSLEAKVYLLGAGKVKIQELQIWQMSF